MSGKKWKYKFDDDIKFIYNIVLFKRPEGGMKANMSKCQHHLLYLGIRCMMLIILVSAFTCLMAQSWKHTNKLFLKQLWKTFSCLKFFLDYGHVGGGVVAGVGWHGHGYIYYICNCCSVTKSCPALCHPIDWSMPGFTVLHCLPEFAQTHVHWVDDAIQHMQYDCRKDFIYIGTHNMHIYAIYIVYVYVIYIGHS